MRRAILAIAGTITSLVLLLSFKTHSLTAQTPTVAIGTATPGASGPTGGSTTGSTAAPSTGATSTAAPSSGSSTSSAAGSKTVTGDAVDTRWGPVQVQITVTDGKLTGVTAIEYPTANPRDQEINAYAIPALTDEALAAGNAQIDMITCATVTSEGYIASLQSALDKAGL